MPEAEVQVNPNQFRNLPLQQLIDLRVAYDESRKIEAKKDKVVKNFIDEIDAVLLEYHEANPEVLQVAGSTHKIGFSEEEVYSPATNEREDFFQWCIANDMGHLLTWKINNASARSHVLLQPELPHTSLFVKKKISMRKA
jgi:hypothetical protein